MHWGPKALDRLFDEYEHCDRCPALCESRSNVVLGSGSATADLMIIGEGPGREEDEYNEPFVGPTGQLMMDMIQMRWPDCEEISALSKYDEGEDGDEGFFDDLRQYLDRYIYWTNTTLCWTGQDRNTPSAKELKACRERLHREIYAVDPMLIIATGKTAATALLGKKVSVIEKRGSILDIDITSPVSGTAVRYPAMVILQPSHLLRTGSQDLVSRKKGETYETIEDLGYAIGLLDAQYQDLFGTNFPFKPKDYKKP